jgi:hypothetical protein
MLQRFFPGELIRSIGRQWWFLPLLLLPQLILPYSSVGYKLRDWGIVNAYILTHPIKSHLQSFFPIFQIIPLVLLITILFIGNRANRLFSGYVFLSYALSIFLQNFSTGEKYGIAICTANVITFFILAFLWLWDAIHPNHYTEYKPSKWKYWPLLPALLAFWGPVNPNILTPDFNPIYLLTSGTGLSFCMSTPLYLAILIAHFPHVNKTVFLATGFIGVFMALGNFALEFVIEPSYWWIGVLHLPLFILSCYCLALSFSEVARQAKRQSTAQIIYNA